MSGQGMNYFSSVKQFNAKINFWGLSNWEIYSYYYLDSKISCLSKYDCFCHLKKQYCNYIEKNYTPLNLNDVDLKVATFVDSLSLLYRVFNNNCLYDKVFENLRIYQEYHFINSKLYADFVLFCSNEKGEEKCLIIEFGFFNIYTCDDEYKYDNRVREKSRQVQVYKDVMKEIQFDAYKEVDTFVFCYCGDNDRDGKEHNKNIEVKLVEKMNSFFGELFFPVVKIGDIVYHKRYGIGIIKNIYKNKINSKVRHYIDINFPNVNTIKKFQFPLSVDQGLIKNYKTLTY